MMKKLVVIPSDPIHAYEAKGTSSWIKDYYNPQGYFDEVYVLSPLEKNKTEKYGLKIIPVSNNVDYKKKLRAINGRLGECARAIRTFELNGRIFLSMSILLGANFNAY